MIHNKFITTDIYVIEAEFKIIKSDFIIGDESNVIYNYSKPAKKVEHLKSTNIKLPNPFKLPTDIYGIDFKVKTLFGKIGSTFFLNGAITPDDMVFINPQLTYSVPYNASDSPILSIQDLTFRYDPVPPLEV